MCDFLYIYQCFDLIIAIFTSIFCRSTSLSCIEHQFVRFYHIFLQLQDIIMLDMHFTNMIILNGTEPHIVALPSYIRIKYFSSLNV